MRYRSESSLTVVIAHGACLFAVIVAWAFARRPTKPAVARNYPVGTHLGAASRGDTAPPSSMRLKERVRSEKFGPITDW